MIKENKGITLVALVITIIILLILAGITINSLTNSGLLTKAGEAAKLSKLKEIEEFAQIAYMARQLEEISGGENAAIAGVISDLKEKGYTIKEVESGVNSITGIALSEEDITMERNTEKTITYTFVYSDETKIRYFAEVEGKDYEIIFDNGEIRVNTEETNLGEINKGPEVMVISSDNSIIETNKTEEGKIILTAKNELGDVEITIKETNSNVTKTFTATTRIAATGLTISQAEVIIKVEETLNLTATVEPSNTTDEIIWGSSDESIATVTQEGVVIGINPGIVTITVTCGMQNKTCSVTVMEPPPELGTVSTATHTARDLTYSWNEIAKLAEVISKNSSIIKRETTEEVNITMGSKEYKIGIGDRMKVNGKVVRVLGFNHDEMSDAQKRTAYDGAQDMAGISFEYVDILETLLQWKTEPYINDDDNWRTSIARASLNGNLYSGLPGSSTGSSPKDYIKRVKKEYTVKRSTGAVSECDDLMWLLSATEIYGGNADGRAAAVEGIRYKYYVDLNPTTYSMNTYMKKPYNLIGSSGAGVYWWLRTGYRSEARRWLGVNDQRIMHWVVEWGAGQ